MGAVACPKHGTRVGILVSRSLADLCLAGGAVSPKSIRQFEVDMDGTETWSFWSDVASLEDAGLPTNRKLTMEEFFETDSFKCFPICPDCARQWLREYNIEPKDIGLG
jgi:hypothetical protein